MKNKGFTLIELLGTIVIIGVLGTIAIVSVVNIKKSSNERFNKAQIEIIRQAGQNYFTDNKKLLPVVEGQSNFVSLDELIEKNYLDEVYDANKKLLKMGEDSNGTPYSYVWVQKQENGEYYYGVYCEDFKDKDYVMTIPISEANESEIEIKYIGDFYDKTEGNKTIHYTNGKTDASVEIKINKNEVKSYKYEILKKIKSSGENNGSKQLKVSERTSLTAERLKIKLDSKDYGEGEYYIRVTTYNASGRPKNKVTQNESIYVDKTAPTCEVLTDYDYYKNSKGEYWYSSISTKNGEKLGVDKKLPIYATGEEEKGSGVGSVSIYGDSGYRNLLNSSKSAKVTYEASNTTVDGKMYYAVVEDNVGNKSYCKKSFKIDTEVPTCEVISESSKDMTTDWYNINSTGKEGGPLDIQLISNDNVRIDNKGLTTLSTVTYNDLNNGTQNDTCSGGTNWYGYVKDEAGNEGKCSQNFKVDLNRPTIESLELVSQNDSYQTNNPSISYQVNDYNSVTVNFLNNNDNTWAVGTTNILCSSNSIGVGSISYPFSLDNYTGATYNITAIATDDAGNQSNPIPVSYEVYQLCDSIKSNGSGVPTCQVVCEDNEECSQCGEGTTSYTYGYVDEFFGSLCEEITSDTDESCDMATACDDSLEEEEDDSNGTLKCPTIKARVGSNKMIAAKTWTNKTITLNIDFSNTNATYYQWQTNTPGKFEKNNANFSNNANASNMQSIPNSGTTSKTIAAEGKRQGRIIVCNNEDCTKKRTCYTKRYYYDKTAPTLSIEQMGINRFSGTVSKKLNQCKGKKECGVKYSSVDVVVLTATNKLGSGADSKSALGAWGARARYANDKNNQSCHTDYQWNGAPVCTRSAKLNENVIRCYTIRDKAGNVSDEVCSCMKVQPFQILTGIKYNSSSCFS